VVRLLISAVTVSFSLAWGPAGAETPERHRFVFGADISYIDTSGLPSWTDGSVGKLRFDDDSDGLVLNRAFVDYQGLITDTINANVVLEIYDDDLGSAIDLTEAFLEWRPVPRSPNRYRVKVGAFYPRISLENTDAGWGSPYTLNSSAINTWVAEELRTFGAEFSVSRRPQSLGGTHQFGLQAAVFWANDPAGIRRDLSWPGKAGPHTTGNPGSVMSCRYHHCRRFSRA